MIFGTKLEVQKRGDTFDREFTLGNGWVGADFDGVKFTLRTEIPPSSTVTDSDAVDQASVATGEITFVGNVGTIVIPASRTTAWPGNKKLFWDLQGVIDASEDLVYTVDDGTIVIDGDVTRST